MNPILSFLLNPKTIFIYGPLSAFCFAEGIALVYLWIRHEKLHQDRLLDLDKLKDEYVEVVNKVDKTLNILISVLGKKKGE